jgi:hypothetical protein
MAVPVLQIRMLEELHAWVMANGGSPFARKILEQARLNDGKIDGPASLPQPEPAPVEAAAAASASEPAVPPKAAPPASEEDCVRWMHHRKGQFCKSCGRTP